MDIYLISAPRLFKIEALKKLLEVLNIKHVINLNVYKKVTPLTIDTHHQVFSSIPHKYELSSYLPEDLRNKNKEDRNKIIKKAIQSIFSPIVNLLIDIHRNNDNNDKENILILTNTSTAMGYLIDYSTSYFFNRLYYCIKKTSPRKQYRHFVEYIRLDFISQTSYRYSVMYNTFKNNNLFINKIYSSLLAQFQTRESDLWKEEIYSRISKVRDEQKQIKEQRAIENYDYEYDSQELDDMYRSAFEGDPEAEWNID